MELGGIVQFLEGKTILLIGATGFLGKIFVEKILRIQRNVKKLYLLLRAADPNFAAQRLNDEVVKKDVFKVLRERWGANLDSFISEKVTPVPGDISCENLGVRDSNLREEMWKEIDIIVNFAATTNFDARYDVAFGINTLGALNVVSFAKKCVSIEILLHVSTAYVWGESGALILEKPFYMGETLNGTCKLDIDSEKNMVEEKLNELRLQGATEEAIKTAMMDFGIKRARQHGWPNTYVFTKAMGEMLLGHFKDNLPLVIIRPTMVTSTCKEPFPGWIEGLRTIDSVIFSYGKGKLAYFIGYPELILDVIPADMVVNSVMVAMVAHANQPAEIIYHVGSSLRNPLKFITCQGYCTRYFTQNPLTNKKGKPIKVSKKGVTLFGTTAKFRRYVAIRYVLPLKGLRLVNTVSRQHYRDTYVDLDRKIKFLMRLVELYKHYAFFKGIFDDTNTEKLRMTARESGVDMDAFNFDPKSIDWEDYLINTHIPGLVKHVFK